jgi:phage terminase small subunit
MPRERNPNRDKAYQIWLEHDGKITNRQIAELLGENEKVVAVWKQRDKWNVVQQSKESCTTNGTSWVDIESEFVTDVRKKPISLKDLAMKYNLSYSSLRRYAAENQWSDKRKKHVATVKQKTTEKAANIIAADVAKATARHFSLSSKLLDVVEKAVSDPKEFNRFVEKLRIGNGPGEFTEEITAEEVDALNDAKLLNVVNALDKIQKMQRQTLGILDEKDKKKLELETYKALPKDEDGEETESDGFEDAWSGKVEEVWSNYDPSKDS